MMPDHYKDILLGRPKHGELLGTDESHHLTPCWFVPYGKRDVDADKEYTGMETTWDGNAKLRKTIEGAK